MRDVSYKWLPYIDLEKCNGCGKCVEVCTPKCLKLVNDDFVLLFRANWCDSEGNCIEPCSEEAIRMEWIEMTGDHSTGLWKTVLA